MIDNVEMGRMELMVVIRKTIRKQDLTSDVKSASKQIKDSVLTATNVAMAVISEKIVQKIRRHRSGGG